MTLEKIRAALPKDAEWVPGFKYAYAVNRSGEIISYLGRKKILKPTISNTGYCRVDLQRKGIRVPKLVHRIVAETFIPNPQNKRTVNHKNKIKTDNRVENLEWATDQENILHSFIGRKGTYYGKLRGACPNAKRVVATFEATGHKIEFQCCADAGDFIGVSGGMISLMCKEIERKKRKSYRGYILEYKT